MSRNLPFNRQAMNNAGYELLGIGICYDCKAHVEWWKTTYGKKIPFNLAEQGTGFPEEILQVTAHRTTCPNGKLAKLLGTAPARMEVAHGR